MKANTLRAAFVGCVLALGTYAAEPPASATDKSMPREQPPKRSAVPGKAATNEISSRDRTFITDAFTATADELRSARYVEEYASNDQVKRLAMTIVGDHSRAMADLEKMATRYDITLPKAKMNEEPTKLSKMKGVELDRAFIDQMIQDHQRAIEVYQRESNVGQNPEVQQFATQLLPVLSDHLKMARDLKGVKSKVQPGT